MLNIEKRATIGQIIERMRPDLRLIKASVEVTELCSAERPPKTIKWSYSETAISSQRGRMFGGGLAFATSEFQGEAPIFSALNEAQFALGMKAGRHERKGPLTTYRTDDGKSVARTYKATVEFELKEQTDTPPAASPVE